MLIIDLPTDVLIHILDLVSKSTTNRLYHAQTAPDRAREERELAKFMLLATVCQRFADVVISAEIWRPFSTRVSVEHLPRPWELGRRWNSLFNSMESPLSDCLINLNASSDAELERQVRVCVDFGRNKFRVYYGRQFDDCGWIWHVNPSTLSYARWRRVAALLQGQCTRLSVCMLGLDWLAKTPVAFVDLLHWQWPRLTALQLDMGHSSTNEKRHGARFIEDRLGWQKHTGQYLLPELRSVTVKQCRFDELAPTLRRFVPKLQRCVLGFGKTRFGELRNGPRELFERWGADWHLDFHRASPGLRTVVAPTRMAITTADGPAVRIDELLYLEDMGRDFAKDPIVVVAWAHGVLRSREVTVEQLRGCSAVSEFDVKVNSNVISV